MAIVIEAADETVVAGPLHARRIEPGGHRIEEGAGLFGQEIVDPRRGVGDRAIARILGIEDAHRILIEPRKAVLRQVAAMRLEMRHQRGTPGVAGFRIAQGIELKRHAVGDAEFMEQLIRERQQLDVSRRLGRAEDFGVDLVELAIAPLLRTLVAEHRARGRDLQRRELLPSFGQISAGNPGGELRSQRQRIAAAIGEGVHFLRHDVGRLADRAGEDFRRLEHRDLDTLEAIELAHAIEGIEHMGEATLFAAENVLRAADAVGSLDTGHHGRI